MSEPQDQIIPEEDEDIVQVNVSRHVAQRGVAALHTWLAEKENLDLLGREIGLSLELVQREKPIGSLYS